MTARRPPGGHSSILLSDNQEPAHTPYHGRKLFPTTPSSIIFGDDHTAKATGVPSAPQPVPVSQTAAAAAAAAIDTLPVKDTAASQPADVPSRIHLTHTERAAEVVEATNNATIAAVASVTASVAAVSRSASPSIIPSREPEPLRTGRRNFGREHSGSNIFGEAPAAAEQPVRVASPGFKSSISFGDDSPFNASFEDPASPSKRRYLKPFQPPSDYKPQKLHELIGAPEHLDDPVSYRLDPTAMEVAGKPSGKHGVY